MECRAFCAAPAPLSPSSCPPALAPPALPPPRHPQQQSAHAPDACKACQFGTQQGQLGGEPVAFTPAQHGRVGTHIAQAMPRDARLRAPFSAFEQCVRVAPSSSFALARCGPNPFLKISTVSCTPGPCPWCMLRATQNATLALSQEGCQLYEIGVITAIPYN